MLPPPLRDVCAWAGGTSPPPPPPANAPQGAFNPQPKPSFKVGLRAHLTTACAPFAHSKLGTAETEPPVLTFDTVSGSQCSRPPLRVKPQGAPPCSCTGTYWKDPGRFSILHWLRRRRAPFPQGLCCLRPQQLRHHRPPALRHPAPPCSAYSPGWRRSAESERKEEMTRSWRKGEKGGKGEGKKKEKKRKKERRRDSV